MVKQTKKENCSNDSFESHRMTIKVMKDFSDVNVLCIALLLFECTSQESGCMEQLDLFILQDMGRTHNHSCAELMASWSKVCSRSNHSVRSFATERHAKCTAFTTTTYFTLNDQSDDSNWGTDNLLKTIHTYLWSWWNEGTLINYYFSWF